jgi:hypothetical protein
VLEVVARRSSAVELATTSTPGTARGSAPQSSAPELPAEAATNTPPSTSPRTAAASVSDSPKLHDITATAGRCAFRETQSIPARSDDSVATPLQSSTFTDRTCAPGATPWSREAAMPATTVPWPSQSPVPGSDSGSTVFAASRARPPNSGCAVSTPVSST